MPKISCRNITELDVPHSRKAFEEASIQTDASGILVMDGSRFARFSHEGQIYLAMFPPFSNPQWPWIIGVYLPEDDYLGAIKSNRFFNMVVTMGISLFAAVAGLFLARGVIRPVAVLGRTSQQIKVGQSTSLPPIRSAYSEIQDTVSAFADMKSAVERSCRKYHGILNNINYLYYEASLNGKLTEISPSIEKISPYRRQELIGKNLLASKLETTSNLSDNLRAIEQCVESGASLTRQLLGYARGGKYQVAPVNLNETVQRTADMFGRTKKEIQSHTRYQENIWMVEADQGQIDQVLVNLYVNAWQAMNTDTTLALSTENVNLDEAYTATFGVKPGPFVAISVQDRGKGIEPDTMKRIFEPFFTTKKMGRGTGLGLASAFGIIKNHGGIIDVESRVSQGTRFTIYLPAASRPAEKASVPTPDPPLKGSGTLLVVDDEPYILSALTGILHDLGFHVIPADSGRQAIALFEKKRDQIDGVLLDMIMPDLSGRQVLAQLKKMRPGIKVLLSSGYSLNGLGKEENNASGDGFIEEPRSKRRGIFDRKECGLF